MALVRHSQGTLHAAAERGLHGKAANVQNLHHQVIESCTCSRIVASRDDARCWHLVFGMYAGAQAMMPCAAWLSSMHEFLQEQCQCLPLSQATLLIVSLQYAG